VPRLLFYAFLAILAAMWMRRLSAQRTAGGPASKGQAGVKGMPRLLVCGACGKDYEPLTQGWLCPHCQR
jgi:hypothetical protein